MGEESICLDKKLSNVHLMSTTPSPNKATKSKIDYLFSQQKNPSMVTDLAEDKKILLKNLAAGEKFYSFF